MKKEERLMMHEKLDFYLDQYHKAVNEMLTLAADDEDNSELMAKKSIELVSSLGVALYDAITPAGGLDPIILPTFMHIMGCLHDYTSELFESATHCLKEDEAEVDPIDEVMTHFWDEYEEDEDGNH